MLSEHPTLAIFCLDSSARGRMFERLKSIGGFLELLGIEAKATEAADRLGPYCRSETRLPIPSRYILTSNDHKTARCGCVQRLHGLVHRVPRLDRRGESEGSRRT
jgi:hypothetical protein